MRNVCFEARKASYVLQSLTSEERSMILKKMADSLIENEETILAANKDDLTDAIDMQVARPLLNRLKLTKQKIQTLKEVKQLSFKKKQKNIFKKKKNKHTKIPRVFFCLSSFCCFVDK